MQLAPLHHGCLQVTRCNFQLYHHHPQRARNKLRASDCPCCLQHLSSPLSSLLLCRPTTLPCPPSLPPCPPLVPSKPFAPPDLFHTLFRAFIFLFSPQDPGPKLAPVASNCYPAIMTPIASNPGVGFHTVQASLVHGWTWGEGAPREQVGLTICFSFWLPLL